MAERLVDRLKHRIDEVRIRGIIPTVRTRVEELVSQVRERVETGVLTRESGEFGPGATKRKIKGL